MANATKILIIINDSSASLVNLPATTFRDNIRSFLTDYAETQDYTLDIGNNTTVSRLFLAIQATGVRFPLFVIEEQISRTSSSYPNSLCDFCKCVGWSHHYISKRKYHLIIPASDEWDKPLTKDSLEVTSSRHLLHGVIHCNGFGHLLCINSDGVSGYLSGDRVMDLWDRLCSALHTRKISLDDTSRKGSLDLRLLHGVAYGRSWFGKWDYTLSHGIFGVTKDQYTRAIHILSSMELDKIVKDFSRTRKEIPPMKMIIGFYRDSSQTPLTTLSELLKFILALGSKAPIGSCSSPEPEDNGNESSSTKYDSFDAMAAGEGCKWSGKRLSDTAQAVLNAFRDRDSVVLTRQELCEAVSGSILDRALVNFLLIHIEQVPMGDQIIKRTTQRPRVIRFSLTKVIQEAYRWRSTAPGLDPYEDVRYLYRNLFLTYPDHSEVYSDASEAILNCNSFVKEWPLSSHQGQEEAMITVSCQVMLNHEELLRDFTRKLPPGELVTVSRNATIGELKSALEKALRDTYCVMENFEVLEIRNKDLVKMDENSGLESEGGEIKREFLVTGFGLDTCTELRYEGGFDDWIVDCKCGAVDDDGERMVACDACKVWHHTKCHSIEDDEDVTSVFLCPRC